MAAAAASIAGIAKAKMTPASAASLRRKRLSDMTNLVSGQENPQNPDSAAASKEAYIAQLLKENNALMRAVGERNKVIQANVVELQSVRSTVQKQSQQNQQLARANTAMLAERNQDKEKLKALQHELGCVRASLKSLKLELQEEKKLTRQLRARIGNEQVIVEEQSKLDIIMEDPPILEDQTEAANTSEQDPPEAHVHSKLDLVMEDTSIPAGQKKVQNTSRKRVLRSQSLGSAVANEQEGIPEKDVSSSKPSRRRTAGSKNVACEPNESIFEIDDVNLSGLNLSTDDSMSRDSSTQVGPSTPVSNASTEPVKEEQLKKTTETPEVQIQEEQRSTVGRPMRRAAVKVSSYKEVPLNVKMRRSQ